MNRILLLLLAIAAISCEKKPLTPQEIILGNWSVVDTTTTAFTHQHYEDKRGFEFVNDSICDYKLGFFDYNRNDVNLDRSQRVSYFLGTKTRYILNKDSLKIFNLSEKKWDAYSILKFSHDTIVLSSKEDSSTLVRKNYDDSGNDFDAIVVSAGPCYGSCPGINILIEKEGYVRFTGKHNVIKTGDFSSQITKADFEKISNRFKQANYMNLEDNYHTMVSCSRTVSVSFIKDGKIVKSITDYAASSPNEFIWAYTPLTVLDQSLNLKPIKVKDFLNPEWFIASFKNSKQFLFLSDAEVFFLVHNLENAPEVETGFKETYLFDIKIPLVSKITTDGQYYKFYFKDDKSKTFDIGYNFLNNKLSHKFE